MDQRSSHPVQWSSRATALFLAAAGCLAACFPGIGHASSDSNVSTTVTISKSSGRLAIQAGMGLMTSGDLFKVDVTSGNPHFWLTPADSLFASEEFVVTMDEDLLLGASVSFRFAGHWWLRADVSYSKVDATAEALVGQTVQLFLYDRLAFLMGGLVIERPLISTPSYPFFLAGGTLVKVTADNARELDQTQWGLRLGAGYHHDFDGRWGLRVEVRDTITSLDTSGHRPSSPEPEEFPYNYLEIDTQNLFEITLMVQRIFN